MEDIEGINYQPSFVRSEPTVDITIVVCLMLGVCMLASLFSNSILLWVLKKQPSMHNFHFVSLGNLALSDISALLLLPITLLKLFWPRTFLGGLLCSAYLSLPTTNLLITTLTTTALSFVRLQADTSFQFAPKQDCKEAVLVMIFIWGVSSLLSIPHFIFSDDSTGFFCLPNWPSSNLQLPYQLLTSFLPLCVASVIIILALLKARRQNNQRKLREEGHAQLDARFDVMLLIYWSVFFVVKTTTQLMLLTFDSSPYINMVLVGTEMLAMLTSASKAILFICMEGNLKQAFKLTFSRQ